MESLSLYDLIATAQVLVGAVIMIYAIFLALRIRYRTNPSLSRHWNIIIRLLGFFLFGYFLFAGNLVRGWGLSSEMMTGAVFFGGALFVYIVMTVTRSSLATLVRREKEIEKECNQRQLEESKRQRYQLSMEKLDRWMKRLLSAATDENLFYRVASEAIDNFVRSDLSLILIIDSEGTTFSFRGALGEEADKFQGLTLSLTDAGYLGWLMRHGETRLVKGLEKDERAGQGMESQFGFRSVMLVPLRHEEQVIGGLAAFSREESFDEIDLQILEQFAQRAMVAYANMKLIESQEQRVIDRTDQLQDKNKLLEGIVSHIPSHVFWKTPQGQYVGCNQGFVQFLGLARPSEVIGRSDIDLPWNRPILNMLEEMESRVLTTGTRIVDQEISFQISPGKSVTCLTSIVPMKDGFDAITGILGILKDITPRKQAELSMKKLNRALQTLSAGSAAIVHASTEERLISQVCRLVVETGGYHMAWLGFQDKEDPQLVRQAGRYCEGQDPEEVESAEIRLAKDDRTSELISRALLQGHHTFIRKQEGTRCSPLCPGLTSDQDYGSAIALPLMFGAENPGVLAIYAREKDAFDEDEIQLLSDLAANFVHGIMARREAQRRKEAEAALEQERAFLQMVIDGVSDPTMVIGPDHRILMMNKASFGYLSNKEDMPTELRCHQVIHERDEPCPGDSEICPLQEVQRTGKTTRVVQRHPMGDGRKRTFEIDASPLWNHDGSLRGVIKSARDISDRLAVEATLRENQDRLDYLAHHDPLTNLPNRLHFNQRLREAMVESRDAHSQLALLFLDLDRFKNINDSLGHEIGDQVLREVSNRLHRCLRGGDVVARLGGDEFVVILEELEDLKAVALVARNILRAMSRGFHIGNHDLFVSASIGISLYPDDAEDAEGLMKFADVAMYRAKEEGRNNYQFYRPEMNYRTRDLLIMEGNLRKAMEEKQLRVYYQPQFRLENRQLVGFEALLRWEHPEHGMVSPGDFIPLAEESGLIVPLGLWVLHTACSQARLWQKKGYTSVRIAVNISAREFRQPDFVDNLDAILEETGLDPHWLELEITESIAMQNLEETMMTLTDLKIRGVHLAIDDFGTGYSSLGYLKRFPIAKLKIDQSFVRDINRDSNVEAIAGSIIALGRSMNMEVIAEGVEREEQARLLLDKGCHSCQGFLFSPAVPAEEAEAFLQAKNPTTRSTVIRPPQFSQNQST